MKSGNCSIDSGVKVEPRSNNAIAAGSSSFTNDAAAQKLQTGQENEAFDIARRKTKVSDAHHQRFDVERHLEKAKATRLAKVNEAAVRALTAEILGIEIPSAWSKLVSKKDTPKRLTLKIGEAA